MVLKRETGQVGVGGARSGQEFLVTMSKTLWGNVFKLLVFVTIGKQLVQIG